MNKLFKSLPLFAALIWSMFAGACLLPEKTYSYGERIAYRNDQTIKFPDFSLHFLGSIGSSGCDECTENMFYATRGGKDKNISWFRKRGDIEPHRFELDGKEYVLEKDTLLALPPEETDEFRPHSLIVWEKDEFERRRKEAGR